MDEDPTLEQEMNSIIGTAVESELLRRAIETITLLRIRVETQAQGLRDARAIIEQLKGETA
jgi:hypothetical protein